MTFTEKVLEVVKNIPKGSVLSYGEVARMAGSAGASRAVGSILKKNYREDVPCHRVIRANGDFGEYNRGKSKKVKRLEEEGYVPYKYIVGIDEVGRGPIAGPVAVGAFMFLTEDAKKSFRGVRESKQLTEGAREEWFKVIESKNDENFVKFSVCFQSEKVIDKKGLSFAIKKCLENCLKNLKVNPDECLILLDGGLKAPAHFKNQKTIIKGDTKENVIALASICAKVLRDRKMKNWAKKFPGYGFEVHKGYGTRGHYKKVKEIGISDLHRKSFLTRLK